MKGKVQAEIEDTRCRIGVDLPLDQKGLPQPVGARLRIFPDAHAHASDCTSQWKDTELRAPGLVKTGGKFVP